MKKSLYWFGVLVSLLPALSSGQIPGSLDTNFVPGTASSDVFWCMALQGNGKIIAAGYETTAYGVIYRLGTNGAVDPRFASGTRATYVDTTVTPQINTVTLQTNGNIVVGGQFTYFDAPSRLRLAQLDSSGALDANFKPSTRSSVFASAVQPDGKIIIAGAFTNLMGKGKNYVGRISDAGTFDDTFNQNGTGPDNTVRTIFLATNGSIYLGGDFTNVNGSPRRYVAKLLGDGSLDATFDPGIGPNDSVEGLTVQTDGKVLIGGWFSNISGTNRSRIARLNQDGSLDTTFDPGSGCDSRVYTFATQGDRIFAAGRFNNFNGTPRSKIVCLDSSGNLDPTFDATAGSGANSSDEIRSMIVQPDGKILVAGKFTVFSGQSRRGVARLNGFSTVTRPQLSIQTVNVTNVTLDWTGAFILQSATNPAGPYVDSGTGTNRPVVIPTASGSEFFRLRN